MVHQLLMLYGPNPMANLVNLFRTLAQTVVTVHTVEGVDIGGYHTHTFHPIPT